MTKKNDTRKRADFILMEFVRMENLSNFSFEVSPSIFLLLLVCFNMSNIFEMVWYSIGIFKWILRRSDLLLIVASVDAVVDLSTSIDSLV